MITYLANFFGRSVGVPQPCEILVELWRGRGLHVDAVSGRRNRVTRLADFVRTAFRCRGRGGVVVIDTFSGNSFLWAALAARIVRGRCPIVAVLHGGGLPEYAAAHPRLVASYLASAARVVSPSPFLATRMKTAASAIEIIPNPVDSSVCVPREGPRVPDPSAARILWLRAFHRIYDPVRAVEALALARRDCPAATLTMVGPDKDGSLQEVNDEVSRLGLGDAVRLPGPVPKTRVPEIMHDHDIFLSTSTIDNAPVSVIEAMACGLPVVATAVGGVPDLLGHGSRGILVPVGDAASMARALVRAAQDEALATAMSTAARHKARENGFDNVTDCWMRLLRDVGANAGDPGPPRPPADLSGDRPASTPSRSAGDVTRFCVSPVVPLDGTEADARSGPSSSHLLSATGTTFLSAVFLQTPPR